MIDELHIQTKEDHPDKTAAVVGIDSKYYTTAGEFNEVVAKVNEVVEEVNGIVVPPSLTLGTTETTAHRGDHGNTAYQHSNITGNPHGTTKAQVGLGNVDNTSDANKPVSTAQATAISAVATASVVTGSDSNTTVKNLSTVTSYPATPVANTLYFVETSELEAPISVIVSAGTTVTIAHGQSFVPSFVSVQAKNATARGTFSIDVDGTNITLTYASAITAGTAEYWLRWKK